MFKGRQLHLVKAETTLAFISKEFKLVEALGYALGGFFLANYEGSPAGMFDEVVFVYAKTMLFNATLRLVLVLVNYQRCGRWATRVLGSSVKACVHGQKDVGLSSQVAHFTKSVKAVSGTKRSQFGGFLNKIGMDNM
ncbi:hypothetical protein CDL12_08521 [Handroanthus impetiginosus]|uniref:Uncharacterized protein n=1 Tax=Handroanthus impetiginosus TaxID=429701 RepID=A0A2G9HMY9_9LAMI|nr:hypothetical protein CDL12_08521 [Handroanthus impetiginosus]